jgi:RNA polymerase sigma factor (TIGR02999 family)
MTLDSALRPAGNEDAGSVEHSIQDTKARPVEYPASDTEVEKLFAEFYRDINRRAQLLLHRERNHYDWDDSEGLVHETFLRFKSSEQRFENREHFMAVMYRTMRQVLVDEARRRNATKRGQGAVDQVDVEYLVGANPDLDQVLALDEALSMLPQAEAETLHLRYFAGMTMHEVAETQGIGLSSAKRNLERGQRMLKQLLKNTSR